MKLTSNILHKLHDDNSWVPNDPTQHNVGVNQHPGTIEVWVNNIRIMITVPRPYITDDIIKELDIDVVSGAPELPRYRIANELGKEIKKLI